MRYTATLSKTCLGRWELYIAGPGRVDDWPVADFDRAAPVPTIAERAAALAALGYELPPGGAWRWDEDQMTATEQVELSARVDVRPIGGAS
ncbi:DUF6303 family protein [Streptomyces sp. NPDC047315]|uniref:DUF6303 family protein n=1 Tax=Streptomyces sp. NPDC047315 TaxID=3155142 RepID=UPI0033E1DF96